MLYEILASIQSGINYQKIKGGDVTDRLEIIEHRRFYWHRIYRTIVYIVMLVSSIVWYHNS